MNAEKLRKKIADLLEPATDVPLEEQRNMKWHKGWNAGVETVLEILDEEIKLSKN